MLVVFLSSDIVYRLYTCPKLFELILLYVLNSSAVVGVVFYLGRCRGGLRSLLYLRFSSWPSRSLGHDTIVWGISNVGIVAMRYNLGFID